MTERRNVSTGTPWEEKFGYRRAVRVGDQVFVSGTIAADESGRAHAPGDAYRQAVFIFEKMERALKELGASRADIVRVRVYLVDMSELEAVGRAHREFFGEVYPTNTTVEVSGLANQDFRVEIEVDAVVTSEGES